MSWRVIALALLVLMYSTPAAVAHIDVFQSSEDESFHESPDGQLEVRIQRRALRSILSVRGRDSEEFAAVQGLAQIQDVQWLPDNKTVVYLGRVSESSPVHLFRTDLVRRLTTDLTPHGFRNAVAFYLTNGGKRAVTLIDLPERGSYNWVEINAITGGTEPIDAPLFYPSNMQLAQAPAVTQLVPGPQGTIGPESETMAHLEPLPQQEQYIKKYGSSLEQALLLSDTGSERWNLGMPFKLKAFTESEKSEVRRLWRFIIARAPGFVLRAAHGRRIVIARSAQVGSSNPSLTPGLYLGDAYASTGPGIIVLGDPFFADTGAKRVFTMVHELVHLSDLFTHLSFSPEWCEIERSKLVQLRAAMKFHAEQGLGSDFRDDMVACYFGMPSIYAATSHSESLAEQAAAWIVEGRRPPAREAAFINSNLFRPDPQQSAVEMELLRMDNACGLQRTAEIMPALQELAKQNPDYLGTRYLLAVAHGNLKQPVQQMAVAANLLKRLQQLGALETDLLYEGILSEVAEAAYVLKNYDLSYRYVKQLRNLDPKASNYREYEQKLLKKAPHLKPIKIETRPGFPPPVDPEGVGDLFIEVRPPEGAAK